MRRAVWIVAVAALLSGCAGAYPMPSGPPHAGQSQPARVGEPVTAVLIFLGSTRAIASSSWDLNGTVRLPSAHLAREIRCGVEMPKQARSRAPELLRHCFVNVPIHSWDACWEAGVTLRVPIRSMGDRIETKQARFKHSTAERDS